LRPNDAKFMGSGDGMMWIAEATFRFNTLADATLFKVRWG